MLQCLVVHPMLSFYSHSSFLYWSRLSLKKLYWKLESVKSVLIALGIIKFVSIICFHFQEASNYLWWAVYLNISIGIWLILFIIIMFATLRWGMAIGGIINAIVIFYFASVLRSYAFEVRK